jgi:hypothetical protein
MLEITITVDTNDADYVEATNKISEKDFKKISPIIKALNNNWKKKKTHNYNFLYGDFEDTPLSEIYPDIPKRVWNTFFHFLPDIEHGFHTIESIKVGPYVEKVEQL